MTDARVLHDAAHGYMARLARFRDRAGEGRIPFLRETKLERIRRACARKFPEMVPLPQLEKDAHGLEFFVQGGGSSRVLAELEDVYATTRLVQRWCTRALAMLRSNQDMLLKIDFDRFPSILGLSFVFLASIMPPVLCGSRVSLASLVS